MNDFLLKMMIPVKNKLGVSISSVENVSNLGSTLTTLIKSILGPVLGIIGAAGVVYAVVLGVQYAKAEDADARKKVQGRLIGALIGAAIIIVGATLCLALNWEKIFTDFSGDSTFTSSSAATE